MVYYSAHKLHEPVMHFAVGPSWQLCILCCSQLASVHDFTSCHGYDLCKSARTGASLVLLCCVVWLNGLKDGVRQAQHEGMHAASSWAMLWWLILPAPACPAHS